MGISWFEIFEILMLSFKGSGLANWHAIFRNGLKNMSGTSGQLNGAAYGKGIYLASESGTSFGYSRGGSVWENCKFLH